MWSENALSKTENEIRDLIDNIMRDPTRQVEDYPELNAVLNRIDRAKSILSIKKLQRGL